MSRWSLVFLASLALIPIPAGAQTPIFLAGAATSNITPPLGSGIVGGFVPFPATHVHDELHARCLVLDDGATKLVFVVCPRIRRSAPGSGAATMGWFRKRATSRPRRPRCFSGEPATSHGENRTSTALRRE